MRSIQLRHVEGPLKLVGPTIQQTRGIKFSVDDTFIELRIPRHSTKRPVSALNPARSYRTKAFTFPPMYPNAKSGWGELQCISRTCDYYGPLFAGKYATMVINLSVYEPRNPKPGISFFHPRVFEYTIAELMELSHGDNFGVCGQEWLAPSQWRPITRFEAVCASFQKVRQSGAPERILELMMPISDTHLLSLSFRLTWSHVVNRDGISLNPDDVHDISAMYQLCSDIMDSLQVKLSDAALAQQAEALNGLEDTSLVAEYPPLKWDPKHE